MNASSSVINIGLGPEWRSRKEPLRFRMTTLLYRARGQRVAGHETRAGRRAGCSWRGGARRVIPGEDALCVRACNGQSQGRVLKGFFCLLFGVHGLGRVEPLCFLGSVGVGCPLRRLAGVSVSGTASRQVALTWIRGGQRAWMRRRPRRASPVHRRSGWAV